MRIAQIAAGQTWGDVNEASLERGLGGRETAAVRLAVEWAKLGHDVVTFANNAEKHHRLVPPGLGRVTFVDTEFSMPMLEGGYFDAIVSWEFPEILGIELAYEPVKLCGMQVTNVADPAYAAWPDAWVALSPWHRRWLESQMPGIRCEVLPNCASGYASLAHEAKGSPLDPSATVNLLYASSPDRGLRHLLNAWPRIRRLWPHAHLHVVYGPKLWANEQRWSHNVHGEMALDVLEGLEQDGVHDHGIVSQGELADLNAAADVLAYPFDPIQPTESGCITVMEAMWHRTLPVITDGDCLAEEFGAHSVVVPLPYDEDAYVSALDAALRVDTCDLRSEARGWIERERLWDVVAPQWLRLIGEIAAEKAAPLSAAR